MDIFKDMLNVGKETGLGLLKAEAAKVLPKETRPDPTTIPTAVATSPNVPTKTIDKKTMLMIGGGIVAAVALVLILKK